MAKHEWTDEELATVQEMLRLLAGYTVEQAEAILKSVAGELKERAVIE